MKGIQLDTTWSIIDKYVTAIPTLIIGNVGMPIGFSFSLAEDYSFYDNIFKNFENAFGFKNEDYITVAQSDQGKPLKSCIKDHSLQHLCCLWHLLVSLGTKKFSQQVCELVSSTCRTDFNERKKNYEQSWDEITDENDIKKLKKTLSKVGLGYENKEIIVADSDKWIEVSMLLRTSFKMPSCTNQLESAHGHKNDVTPRRNSFFASIKRIIEQILIRNHNFSTNFKQNYSRFKRKIRNIVRNTPDDVIQSQIEIYETDVKNHFCKCDEAILMASMMDVHLPCSHLIYLED